MVPDTKKKLFVFFLSSSSFPTTQTQTQAKEQEQEQEQRTKGYSPAIPPGEFLSAYLFFVSGFDRRAFRRAFRSSFFKLFQLFQKLLGKKNPRYSGTISFQFFTN